MLFPFPQNIKILSLFPWHNPSKPVLCPAPESCSIRRVHSRTYFGQALLFPFLFPLLFPFFPSFLSLGFTQKIEFLFSHKEGSKAEGEGSAKGAKGNSAPGALPIIDLLCSYFNSRCIRLFRVIAFAESGQQGEHTLAEKKRCESNLLE
jgi:hypothetical protein